MIVADSLNIVNGFIAPCIAIAGLWVITLIRLERQYVFHVFPGVRILAQLAGQLSSVKHVATTNVVTCQG